MKYRIKNTKESSSKFGECEVCQEWCSEVFMLTKLTPHTDDETGEVFHSHDGNLFGHENCVKGEWDGVRSKTS